MSTFRKILFAQRRRSSGIASGFQLIAHTNGVSGGVAVDTATSSFDSTGSNVIVVGVGWGGGTPPTLSDNKGNNYVWCAEAFGGNPRVSWFLCLTPVVGIGHIITASTASNVGPNVHVMTFFVAGGATFDSIAAGSGTGNWSFGSSILPGTITPFLGQPDHLFLTAVDWDVNSLPSVDSSFLSPEAIIPLLNSYGFTSAYKIKNGDSTSENPSWTQGISSNSDARTNMICLTNYPGYPLITSGLILNWGFNENTGTSTTDNSGTGLNGTLSGATLPTWQTGKIGAASLSFDGTTSYVVSATDNVVEPGSGDFSFGGWIKINTTGVAAIALGKNNAGTGAYFYIGWNSSNQIIVALKGTSGSETIVTVNDGNYTGVFFHVTAVYDSATGKVSVYIDGTLWGIASVAATGPISPGTAFVVGQLGATGTQFLPGSVDEVFAYNRKLSSQEVLALSKQKP